MDPLRTALSHHHPQNDHARCMFLNWFKFYFEICGAITPKIIRAGSWSKKVPSALAVLWRSRFSASGTGPLYIYHMPDILHLDFLLGDFTFSGWAVPVTVPWSGIMDHNVMTQMGRGVIQVKRVQRPRNARVPRGNGNCNGVQSQKVVTAHLKSEQFLPLGFHARVMNGLHGGRYLSYSRQWAGLVVLSP